MTNGLLIFVTRYVELQGKRIPYETPFVVVLVNKDNKLLRELLPKALRHTSVCEQLYMPYMQKILNKYADAYQPISCFTFDACRISIIKLLAENGFEVITEEIDSKVL